MLGPVLADPTMDCSGLDMCRAVVEDSPSKLFIGGRRSAGSALGWGGVAAAVGKAGAGGQGIGGEGAAGPRALLSLCV
jgi:hypothetical protein